MRGIEKIWLITVGSLLFATTLFYYVSHRNNNGGVYEKLSADEVQIALSILSAKDGEGFLMDSIRVKANAADSGLSVFLGEDKSSTLIKRSIALEYIFSKHEPRYKLEHGVISKLLYSYNLLKTNGNHQSEDYEDVVQRVISASCDSVEDCSDEITKVFRKNEFLFKSFAILEDRSVIAMVPKIEVATHSYFWLDDYHLYYEIILWSILGVLCNILYWGTEFIRIGKFNKNEIPIHLAKLLYTPVCAIVIYFSITYLMGDEYGSYHESIGVIVLSFLLGFFSGAAIDFLRRIKEILLPKIGNTTQPSEKATAEDDGIETGNIKAVG